MKHAILIVDDDKLILNTLQKRFESWDMDAFAVATPEEAKNVLKKIVPDIVILDLLLTSEDGSTSILDFMKADSRLTHVPVIVLTNLNKPELKEMLLAQGVKEFLVKGSMSLDDIYTKVLGYLEPEANKS